MAKFFDQLTPAHRAFIEAQHVFFTGTAGQTGRVNVSPKGMDALRVVGDDRILWLNLTGSGNETAGHIRQVNRMTLMWCSFEKRPQILRCYGTARAVHPRDADWGEVLGHFADIPGTRQIFEMHVDEVQTSCGYSIPYMDYAGERDTLVKWAEDKGEEGLQKHWRERNAQTIDGFPTGLTDPDA